MMEIKRKMGIAHFARRIKQPRGIWVKMAFIVVLGLCFVFFWSFLSSYASSFNVQRESFDDIAEPVSSRTKPARNEVTESSRSHERSKVESGSKSKEGRHVGGSVHKHETKKKKEHVVVSHPHKKKDLPKPVVVVEEQAVVKEVQEQVEAETEESESNKEDGEEGTESDGNEGESDGNGDESNASADEEVDEKKEEVEISKKRKRKGPVFDPKAEYSWRLCNTRSKHNYMPCIDNDGLIGRLQSYRHRERSCPKKPVMCLVPLPHDGYDPPVPWPESKSKVKTVDLLYFDFKLVFISCFFFFIHIRYCIRTWRIRSWLHI